MQLSEKKKKVLNVSMSIAPHLVLFHFIFIFF